MSDLFANSVKRLLLKLNSKYSHCSEYADLFYLWFRSILVNVYDGTQQASQEQYLKHEHTANNQRTSNKFKSRNVD